MALDVPNSRDGLSAVFSSMLLDYEFTPFSQFNEVLGRIIKILANTMEKAMAPHSSTLAWKLPWTEEPGGLQSMGSHRVGHD